jgi:hypothetical protein
MQALGERMKVGVICTRVARIPRGRTNQPIRHRSQQAISVPFLRKFTNTTTHMLQPGTMRHTDLLSKPDCNDEIGDGVGLLGRTEAFNLEAPALSVFCWNINRVFKQSVIGNGRQGPSDLHGDVNVGELYLKGDACNDIRRKTGSPAKCCQDLAYGTVDYATFNDKIPRDVWCRFYE